MGLLNTLQEQDLPGGREGHQQQGGDDLQGRRADRDAPDPGRGDGHRGQAAGRRPRDHRTAHRGQHPRVGADGRQAGRQFNKFFPVWALFWVLFWAPFRNLFEVAVYLIHLSAVTVTHFRQVCIAPEPKLVGTKSSNFGRR